MKGDINLLPKKKASDSNRIASGFIVVLVLVIIASGLFMFYYPNMDKIELQKQIAKKELELAKYTATEEEYKELVARLKLLEDRVEAFDNISETNLILSLVLSEIEGVIPRDINIVDLSYEAGQLDISGITTSKDPVLVSQFMVNLRRIERVIYVSLGSLRSYEEGYSFDLTVSYDIELSKEASDETKEESEEESKEGYETGASIDRQYLKDKLENIEKKVGAL